MTYALIDNATLTAVQRLTGEALSKTDDSVDVDIVALENFVQATLFYDRLVAVDDYIEAYRDTRKTAFPEITFLDKDGYGFTEIESVAGREADQLRPRIQGGEFVNEEFRNLIELLQTHIVCTWDINSSVYHLTLKSLSDNAEDFAKYGNIAAAIFSELSDASESGHRSGSAVELVDRYGQPITKGYTVPGAKWNNGGESTGEASGAIKAFVASLVWLANRSIFYSMAGRHLQADTFLYPIRQTYQQSYLSQTCNYGFDYARHIVNGFSNSLVDDVFEIHHAGLTASTGLQLPVFSAWLAMQTGDPAQIIVAARQVRDAPELVEAREQLREVRRLFDESGVTQANQAVAKIMRDIQKGSNDMRIKYGIQTRQGIPITKLVQVYNSYAALKGLPRAPDFGLKMKVPEFLADLHQPRGFRAAYRNLTNDISTVWSLGEARDILGSRVAKERNARAYNPKQEQPRYRNVHSEFKSPM
ncbi:hypothetical protein Tel_01525 [Candidatus Tenderia electrophaga]|uniref:Uncharacterized protein n=1 Tax=Candidatus Tenderia electrophaga TaxID=1748243 RepID=A0A0S2T9W2_9GAMM|nr:hypothetical protein Tel_01525 [Candidatus Tenderia electrophaga]